MAKKRKTYTSPEVKNRWNAKHYETVNVLVPIGSKSEVQQLAEDLGMSTSAYVRHLILEDAQRRSKCVDTLRGGGVERTWQKRREELLEALGGCP